MNTDKSIINRMKKSLSIGKFSGMFYISLIIFDYLFLIFLLLICPRKKLLKQKNFDYEKYKTLLQNQKIKIQQEDCSI